MSWHRDEYSKIDPELEKIFNKYGAPKPFLPTAENIDLYRQRWAAGTKRFMSSPIVKQALDANSPPTWLELDLQIPVRDGTAIDARIYSPNDNPKSGAAVFVIFHGGGWCLGGLDTEEFQCRLWCKKLRVVVVNVAYRLTPEHPFPTGPEDAYDSVKWVAANASDFGGNLSTGFVVGGFSGGATFAATASHFARDEHLTPPITGVFLSIPVLTDQVQDQSGKMFLIRELSRSTEENRDAPLQTEAMGIRFAELSKAYGRVECPMTCPFLFTSHRNLPPTYIQTCGLDQYRDPAFIYEGLLRDAGTETKIDIYPGLPHSFWAVFPQLKATGRWIEDTIGGATWLLKQSGKGKFRPRL